MLVCVGLMCKYQPKVPRLYVSFLKAYSFRSMKDAFSVSSIEGAGGLCSNNISQGPTVMTIADFFQAACLSETF